MEQELGSGLPEGVQVRVVEESSDTIYLVLPSALWWVWAATPTRTLRR